MDIRNIIPHSKGGSTLCDKHRMLRLYIEGSLRISNEEALNVLEAASLDAQSMELRLISLQPMSAPLYKELS